MPDPVMDPMRVAKQFQRCMVGYHPPSRALSTIGTIYQRQVRRDSTASARMASSVNDAAAVEIAT